MRFWLEIVTLVITGFNDSDDELKRLTEFVAGVSPDIPWHATAFHKDYKMTDPDWVATLFAFRKTGYESFSRSLTSSSRLASLVVPGP
jgi:pyruvate formate lyase activating enzyme